MMSAFDLEKLQTLLRDFYNITHIRITIFDDQYQEILSYPREVAPVCQYIRQSREAAGACHQCDLDACKRAARRKETWVYQCHAGLTEAVAPVFLGNLPVAYLLFGHLFSYRSTYEGWTAVSTACRKYGLDESKLQRYVMALPITSRETILSASHILQAVASYLCMDRLITLRQQNLPARIDEYLSQHFTEDIDAATLCDTFGIGKTTLYEIAGQNYGKGIAEQIRSMRIDYAKKCLEENPELGIAEIAERSGFKDYNYFITVFRQYTGTTPRKYRQAQQNKREFSVL